MENTFDLEKLERTGATLNAVEAALLDRLVRGMTRDQLYAIGFTEEECKIIESWYEDYTR